MSGIKTTPMLMSPQELRELSDSIVAAYGKGSSSIAKVAAELGVSSHTVRKALIARGVPMKSGPMAAARRKARS